MAGRTPEQALDAYVERIRRAVDCVADAVVFGSGTSVGPLHALTLFAPGQRGPNRGRLHTHDGRSELVLQIVERDSVVFQPDAVQQAPYDVRTSYYQYRILDRDSAEIVVYHWEPEGRSPVVKPHLHIPAAASVTMPPSASGKGGRTLHLGKLHLPTRRVGIDDVIEFLLADFGVVPNRADWRAVLSGIERSGNAR